MLTAPRPILQASERARELERVYHSRRGHAPQLSISDDSHHVTEAIGDMYGDDHYTSKRNSRPLSFISGPMGETLNTKSLEQPFPAAPPKSPLRAQVPGSHEQSRSPPSVPNVNGGPPIPARRASSGRGTPSNGQRSPQISPPQLSPPPLSRTNSDTANQQFPLSDIDYESSPAGLAQELSNLQAFRRMSMDVNTSDPDLPSFGNFGLPSAAPPHFSEDEDPAKLFWVPARLHPELAPKEFKTFIEEKVDTIRRRSGDSDSLSPDGALGRQGSAGGLRRKKSMLSRQIDSPNGYRDGAERLERKRSGANQPQTNGGLEKLSELVEDPAGLMRRMSIDSARRNSASDNEVPLSEDMPILPSRPIGPGTLKRSTHTNYRRGSIRKGERVFVPKRGVNANTNRQAETDTEESPATSPTHMKEPDLSNLGLSRVQSEPVNGRFDSTDNFSRPSRKKSPPLQQHRVGSAEDVSRPNSSGSASMDRKPSHPVKPFHSRIASNGRTTASIPGYVPPQQAQPIPQIIETPPPQEPVKKQQMQLPERNSSRTPPTTAGHPQQPPPRTQSQPQVPQPLPLQQPSQRQQQQPQRPPLNRGDRHTSDRHASPIKPSQPFDLISQPATLPGNSTRTDNLSIIPNLADERKSDKKSKEKKDSSEGGSRKTSWGWLLGSDEKKEKEEREKEAAKKVKNKLSKQQEKSHDDTRLDVLQTSIQGGRGRESLVLDRESVKLEEERKKESSRKSSGGDAKKEKESGLFSSIFGGGKKKAEKELGHKKGSSMRGLSPDPPPRILKPDIDYNWTRFSILEERAIYRMAHIKLANPRRELYSQVLLSNFMYSYLAKVQQMHPQIQIGTSKQARQAQQQQSAQQKKDQPEEFTQYQRYQQVCFVFFALFFPFWSIWSGRSGWVFLGGSNSRTSRRKRKRTTPVTSNINSTNNNKLPWTRTTTPCLTPNNNNNNSNKPSISSNTAPTPAPPPPNTTPCNNKGTPTTPATGSRMGATALVIIWGSRWAAGEAISRARVIMVMMTRIRVVGMMICGEREERGAF